MRPTPATANANAKAGRNRIDDRLPAPRLREFTGRIRDSAEPAGERRLDHRAENPECRSLGWAGFVPFKRDFTFDLNRALAAVFPPNHRYKARRALRDVAVHVCEQPRSWATIWNDLYRTVVWRHDIRGHSLEFFQASGLTAVDLGAAAERHDTADGLTQFKRGWATGQRTAYLCGRIFDHTMYEAIRAATVRLAPGTFRRIGTENSSSP